MQLLKSFSSFKERLGEVFKDPVDRPTGYEALSIDELLSEEWRDSLFKRSYQEWLSTAPWAMLLGEEVLNSAATRRFVYALRKRLQAFPLIEMGAGESGKVHTKIAHERFGVSEYIAVDRRDVVLASGGIQEDLLRFFAGQESSSANVMAFGVLNEPLGPITWIEHEYVRRLCREIARVVPVGGLLFGDGIYPLGSIDDVEVYLKRAGFVRDSELEPVLDWAIRRNNRGYLIRDPFVLKRQQIQENP